jgi:exonuclease VII small subunit
LAKNKAELKQERMHLKALVEVKEVQEGEQIKQKDLDLINQYTRKELTADELYVYPIILSSNDEDRDYEYFDKKDLDELSKLFVGKTGIFDHSWKSGNQHSRIFKCKVQKAEGQTNFKGKQLYILKAWAYTIKNGHEELIADIDAGILKEVSIGFRVSDLICSICGNSFFDYQNCKHWPGREYTNNGITDICRLRMKEPTEAYEFSFVAVPSNTDAGTTKGVKLEKEGRKKEKDNNKKHQKNSDEEKPSIFYAKISKRGEISMKYLKGLIEKAKNEKAEAIEISVADLEKDISTYDDAIKKSENAEKAQKEAEDKLKKAEPKIKMGDQYVEDLKKECCRLGKMAEGEAFNEEMMEKVFDKCEVEELKSFKSQYEKKVDELYPPQPQTKTPTGDEGAKEKQVDNSKYKL